MSNYSNSHISAPSRNATPAGPAASDRADAAQVMAGQVIAGQIMAGCPMHDLKDKLRLAGMRPTRQRLALGWLLFGKGGRHVTAEMLFEEASAARIHVSLATIYNTLHQFTRAGLVREIAAEGTKTYFDTNVSNHHHFMFENVSRLADIDCSQIEFSRLPEIPEGMEVARIDVMVRLRPKRQEAHKK